MPCVLFSKWQAKLYHIEVLVLYNSVEHVYMTDIAFNPKSLFLHIDREHHIKQLLSGTRNIQEFTFSIKFLK